MQLSVIQEKIHYSQKIIEFKYHIKKRWVFMKNTLWVNTLSATKKSVKIIDR